MRICGGVAGTDGHQSPGGEFVNTACCGLADEFDVGIVDGNGENTAVARIDGQAGIAESVDLRCPVGETGRRSMKSWAGGEPIRPIFGSLAAYRSAR